MCAWVRLHWFSIDQRCYQPSVSTEAQAPIKKVSPYYILFCWCCYGYIDKIVFNCCTEWFISCMQNCFIADNNKRHVRVLFLVMILLNIHLIQHPFCFLSYKVSRCGVRNLCKWFSIVDCSNESNWIVNNFRSFNKPVWLIWKSDPFGNLLSLVLISDNWNTEEKWFLGQDKNVISNILKGRSNTSFGLILIKLFLSNMQMFI